MIHPAFYGTLENLINPFHKRISIIQPFQGGKRSSFFKHYLIMRKAFSVIISSIISITLFSQQRIYEYKDIADREVGKYFDKTSRKITWALQSLMDEDSARSFFGNTFMPVDQEMSFISITFLYSVFSKEINDWYSCPITILKNKKVDTVNYPLKDIPACIIKDAGCNFLQRNDAVKIAVNNGLTVTTGKTETFFWVDSRLNKSYWFVGIHLQKFTDAGSPGIYKQIDAMTGELVK
jgi:hypothetical protein